MSTGRKQSVRMIKFVAELKRNSYPNSQSFAKKLAAEDWLNVKEEIACTPRTIQRDIELLINEYGAPIKFDAARNGYYLTRKTWEFEVPLLCEQHITHFLLSSRLMEDIVPDPLRREIRDSIDDALAGNNSEFLDKTFLESLLIASGQKAIVDPEVFRVIFDAWRIMERIKLTYRKPDKEESEWVQAQFRVITQPSPIWDNAPA